MYEIHYNLTNFTNDVIPQDHCDAFCVTMLLFCYIHPVVIALGNISNIMAVVVLRRDRFSQSSVSFYLAAYAVCNLCILNIIDAIDWYCLVFQKPKFTQFADWTCRLWSFLTYVILYTGIWFLVAMDIDRLTFLTSPRKAKSYCTTFAAKTIAVFIAIGVVVVSVHAMWTFELYEQGCYVRGPVDLHTIIWPWMCVVVCLYIPQALLCVITVLQAVRICQKRGKCVSCSERLPCCSTRRLTFPRRDRKSTAASTSAGNNPQLTSDDFVVTSMVISALFFFMTVPKTVLNLVNVYAPRSMISQARMEMLEFQTEMLSTVNQALPGFVLLACCRDFRLELFALLRLGRLCGLQSTIQFRTSAADSQRKKIEMENSSSAHVQVDYQLCNNNEEHVTNL